MFVKEKQLPVPKSCLEDVKRCSKTIEIPIRNDNSLVIFMFLFMKFPKKIMHTYFKNKIDYDLFSPFFPI